MQKGAKMGLQKQDVHEVYQMQVVSLYYQENASNSITTKKVKPSRIVITLEFFMLNLFLD